MFKLKKNAKRMIGLALAGVVLAGGVQVNAASTSKPVSTNKPTGTSKPVSTNSPASTSRPTYKYANGRIVTYEALEGSVSLCDTEWSKVKNLVNKDLLGVIGGKDYSSQEVGPVYFQNNDKHTLYNYYCIANESHRVVNHKYEFKGYNQERRVHLKDLGMTTSQKNHFPEINDASKWSIEVMKKAGESPVYEWGNATVTLFNKVTCQKCKRVVWTTGRCSDTDKVFRNEVKEEKRLEDVDIKHFICNDCGTQGNWKVSSELELQHDASTKPAVILVYEKNVPKKKTAKFGTINFYSYLNAKQPYAAGLGAEGSTYNYPANLTGWVANGKTKKVSVKKGTKMWYNDAYHSPATLKTSKSSVVSVSNKMGIAGRYSVTAKKKGTATVTATNIWGHKYTFKITVK